MLLNTILTLLEPGTTDMQKYVISFVYSKNEDI